MQSEIDLAGDCPPRLAVLLPCYNEALTIAEVVRGFRQALPAAAIYVFDNASTDETAQRAGEAGATVVPSKIPGKGNVVRHMFGVIEADVYVMADGDLTYTPEQAVDLLKALQLHSADMAVGKRTTPRSSRAAAYRPMHEFGNRLVCWLITWTFGAGVTDVFSGYRAFTRRFVKTVPLHARNFEIELEMTLQALSLDYHVVEVAVPYRPRPPGSISKLNTYRDGFLVLQAFLRICRDYHPGGFFGLVACFLLICSLAAGIHPVLDYVRYRYVFHLPLAVLASALGILAALSLCIGLILASQHRYHRESLDLYVRNFDRENRPRL